MRPMLLLLSLACTGAPVTDDSSAPGPVYDPDPAVVLGGDRPAGVTLPDAYAVDREWPLVIMLHGYSVNSSIQDVIFGLGPQVDTLGFLLVSPEGTEDTTGKQFWNATTECCDFGNNGVDDVGYLSGLIDEARALYPISTVTLVGHSNGGFMSYRMACETPERLDRIAVLAGAVYADEADCVGTAPVSVLHIHGTADDTIGYESAPRHAGAEESVGRWVTKAGCDADPTAGAARNYLRQVDGDETTPSQWSGCADGIDVQLWSAEGGDHAYLDNNATFKEDLAHWAVD
jgi:polyhydroxybutyrate depolymerase